MRLGKSSTAFILAGGSGSRLWPLSSRFVPKQFLRIFSNKSLFQETVLRNLFMGSVVVMVSEDCLEIVQIQLEEIGLNLNSPEIEIIVEPVRKNTAASAILASYYAKKNNVENIAIIPCDHIINNHQAYQYSMENAAAKLNHSKIVAIAVTPDCFSSEYGYISARKTSEGDYRVQSFIEKPKTQPKRLFCEDSHYFWNSGIYWLNANYIIEYAAKYWQASAKNVKAAFDGATFESNKLQDKVIRVSNRFYQHIDDQPFDVIFSEKIASEPERVMKIVKASFDWSDIGSWMAIGQEIIKTYPVNSSIKHDQTFNDIHKIGRITDLQPLDVYDFAPRIMVLEDEIVIIHGDYLCILDKKNSCQILKIKKDDFLNAKYSGNKLKQLISA